MTVHGPDPGDQRVADPWDPARYERFAAERKAPFFDLLALVRPVPGGRAAAGLGAPGEHSGEGRGDLISSNAAMQWVPDHPRLLERLTATLAPGGQLAVQVPANHDHISHQVAEEIAVQEPFRGAMSGYRRVNPVEAPERYAELLERLGFVEQHVRMQIYPHHLAGPEHVIEWARGTLLTDYQRRMPPALFEEFLADYRERLLPRLDQRRPYFYPFKRILFWAAGPADRAAPWS